MDALSKTRRWTAVFVAIVFVIGALTGALVMRGIQQRRFREIILADPVAQRHDLTVYAFQTRLGLNADQRAVLERILAEQQGRYRETMELSRPGVRKLRRELAERLLPVLTESQRATLENLLKEGEVNR